MKTFLIALCFLVPSWAQAGGMEKVLAQYNMGEDNGKPDFPSNYEYTEDGELNPKSILKEYCGAERNLVLLAKDAKRLHEIKKASGGVVNLRDQYMLGKLTVVQKETITRAKRDYQLLTGKPLLQKDCS